MSSKTLMLSRMQYRISQTKSSCTLLTLSLKLFHRPRAGTEKTYLYNYIISVLRQDNYNVCTSAWTGIAAVLLHGDRTIHSTFKVSVSKDDKLRCIVNKQSEYAHYLRSIDVFILDEASMISKPV